MLEKALEVAEGLTTVRNPEDRLETVLDAADTMMGEEENRLYPGIPVLE